MRVLNMCALLGAPLVVRASVSADAVPSLPGFTGNLPSKLYSGYLKSNPGKVAHYMYSESLQSPTTDPVVAWFNGGPGCSSMEGAMSESGLYRINQYTSPPTLSQNLYSWNNITNNLFIEAPAGVGFSYCTTPTGCEHTDTSTAQDNLASIVSFFTAYPELKNNDFWIAGESYAGVYVPSLAYAIYNYNQASPPFPINLRGIMVGNGCIGKDAGHCGNDPTGLADYHDVLQWKGHGLISEIAYDEIMKACPDWANEDARCQQALNDAANAIGDIDVYFLYNTCADPASPAPPRSAAPRSSRAPFGERGMLARLNAARAARGLMPVGTDPNCYGSTVTLESWGNQANVKAALHVSPDIDWAVCSNNQSFSYSPDIADERIEIYPTLTQKAGIQVLVYNGEADLCVPYTDNEWWTRSMNYTVKSKWAAWEYPGDHGPAVGGYITKYDYNFSFATVRGAGHMVAAYHMFADFLEGKL